MDLPMVLSAQWDREFIAYLSSKCPWLGKAEVMGIRWFASADDARLCCNELAMPLVAQAMWLEHDCAVCGWEIRSLAGNVGRDSGCFESSVVPLVCDGRSVVCWLLLVHRKSDHVGLERVLNDLSIVGR
jgi:hypothetical protein